MDKIDKKIVLELMRALIFQSALSKEIISALPQGNVDDLKKSAEEADVAIRKAMDLMIKNWVPNE